MFLWNYDLVSVAGIVLLLGAGGGGGAGGPDGPGGGGGGGGAEYPMLVAMGGVPETTCMLMCTARTGTLVLVV